jgi:hypothetical protein
MRSNCACFSPRYSQPRAYSLAVVPSAEIEDGQIAASVQWKQSSMVLESGFGTSGEVVAELLVVVWRAMYAIARISSLSFLSVCLTRLYCSRQTFSFSDLTERRPRILTHGSRQPRDTATAAAGQRQIPEALLRRAFGRGGGGTTPAFGVQSAYIHHRTNNLTSMHLRSSCIL